MLDPDTAPLLELDRELARLARRYHVASHEVGERRVRPDNIDHDTLTWWIAAHQAVWRRRFERNDTVAITEPVEQVELRKVAAPQATSLVPFASLRWMPIGSSGAEGAGARHRRRPAVTDAERRVGARRARRGMLHGHILVGSFLGQHARAFGRGWTADGRHYQAGQAQYFAGYRAPGSGFVVGVMRRNGRASLRSRRATRWTTGSRSGARDVMARRRLGETVTTAGSARTRVRPAGDGGRVRA